MADESSFIRHEIEFGKYRYETPAGWYSLVLTRIGDTEEKQAWTLATPGAVVGTFSGAGAVEKAEKALDEDVKKRMWS